MATYHIFREVKPDVFANNRISSLLDTKKSTEDLFELYVLNLFFVRDVVTNNFGNDTAFKSREKA